MQSFSTQDWIVTLKPSSSPRELVVEISTLCNMSCAHCFRGSATDLSPCTMSLELFEELLAEAKEVGVRKIVFSGWGEPLTHPEAMHIVKRCRDSGFSVGLNTNGYAVDRFIDLVIDYVDELYISLDSATANTYAAVRGGPWFDSIVQSIARITHVKQVRGSLRPVVKVLFTITRANVGEAGEFIKLATSLGVNEVVFSASIPSQAAGHGILESVESLERACDCVRKAVEAYKDVGLRIATPARLSATALACPFALNRALFIRCDGGITPCIYYAYSWRPRMFGVDRHVKSVVLGRVGRDRLVDVWRGRYAKMFYRLYFKRVPSCLTCSLAYYCSKARTNDVDCLGGEPNCGHCPYYHGLSYCPL